MRKGLLQTLAALAGGAVLLFGMLALAQKSRDYLRDQSRYTLTFDAIDLSPPAALSRVAFLSEVRRRGQLPDKLSLLDEDLAERLAHAFAAHPWVEKVQNIAILPGHAVHVELRYRTPVLAVLSGAEKRAVDGNGLLLPGAADPMGLPLFQASVAPPAGPEGTEWGDPRVTAAARTLAFLQDQRERLHLTGVESTKSGLVLFTASGSRVLWGHAPGGEAAGESSAARKRAHLVDYCRQHGDLDHPDAPCEHDVRTLDHG